MAGLHSVLPQQNTDVVAQTYIAYIRGGAGPLARVWVQTRIPCRQQLCGSVGIHMPAYHCSPRRSCDVDIAGSQGHGMSSGASWLFALHDACDNQIITTFVCQSVHVGQSS